MGYMVHAVSSARASTPQFARWTREPKNDSAIRYPSMREELRSFFEAKLNASYGFSQVSLWTAYGTVHQSNLFATRGQTRGICCHASHDRKNPFVIPQRDPLSAT